MAHYGKTNLTKSKDKVFHCVLASYLSDFTRKITECCKQELTSCVISLITNFLAEL